MRAARMMTERMIESAQGKALSRLLKNSNCLPEVHSAAKAAVENRPLIAALKRCATQNQGRHRVFQQPLGLCGQRLPELNLIPIRVIDPGKATVGFIHSFGVNLYSLLF